MIEGESPVIQALLGTLFTWALTLAGAAMALFLQVNCQEQVNIKGCESEGCYNSDATHNLQGNQRKLLDTSLGFAAGVMLAASYWSLLEPALEMAAGMGSYGEEGEWAFIPVSVGILLGAGFVYAGMMCWNILQRESVV